MRGEARILGLPLRAPRAAALCVLALAVYYGATAARYVGIFDGSELSLAALEFGLGHPPGQPLHTLVAGLFARVFFFAPLLGVALASVIPSASLALPALSLFDRALPDAAPRWLAPLLVTIGLMHGVAWEPATRVEVYPLAALFGLYALALGATLADGRPARALSLPVGLSLGLAAGANPIIAAIAAVALVPWLVDAPRLGARELLRGVLGGLLGLSIYAYLPLAAGLVVPREGVFVWGGLATGDEWLRYLSGADYAGNLSASLATRIGQAGAFVRYLAVDRGYGIFLLAGLGGVLVAARRQRALALSTLIVLFGAVALVASNAIFRVDVPDYLGYFQLASPLLAGASALLLASVARRALMGLGVGVLALTALLAAPGLEARARSRDDVAARLAALVLEEQPRGGLLVVESDHLAGPLLYAQRAEGLRPDVVLIVRGLFSSSWYLEMLLEAHPELRPFAVRGPGGRDGRIARLAAANPGRALRVERRALATQLGRLACPGGLTLRTDCAEGSGAALEPLLGLAAHARSLGAGAVDGATLMPATTLALGVDLEALGYPRAAYLAYTAGLPAGFGSGALPAEGALLDPAVLPARGPPGPPEPSWARARALGEPGRNALLAAQLLGRLGHPDAAARLTLAAAASGLPEARTLLDAAPPPP